MQDICSIIYLANGVREQHRTVLVVGHIQILEGASSVSYKIHGEVATFFKGC